MMGALEGTKVLVVDDDPGMLITLTDVLSATGFDVESASSGHEAIARVQEFSPDCILMDQRMPGLDGLETFKRIRPLAPESVVVFMTAYSSEDFAREALEEGAIRVVPKPLDLEQLIQLLTETLTKTPVLVVDDNSEFCRSLGSALALHSFDVKLAESAAEALAAYRQEPRRVVILDMKLNEESGLDVLPALKKLNPNALVILVTGFTELEDDMRRGLAMKATASFTKPFEVEQLVTTIENAVDRQRAEQ